MEEKGKKKLPLHAIQEDKLWSAINRTHTLIHSLSLSLFFYHRLSLFTLNDAVSSTPPPPFLPCLLLFLAELLLSVFWLSGQPYRWRIVNRTTYVDRLPEEGELPSIDVVIVTTDPDKEPTVEVMNTVVSAMGLDYPAGKLHVYLSDDGGAEVTLRAAKEAWGFATWWLPFCRKYGVECRCPMAYFEEEYNGLESCGDFFIDRLQLKEKYETFKRRVEANLSQRIRETDKENNRTNHPPFIQVINEDCTDPSIVNQDHFDIPPLVYVAREKRSSHPHHFKAGALNVLLRVSGMLSNSPVVLVLDCDMYCNDPTSAKQAMCFYLDKAISPSLAFVEFPQRFRNVSKADLYDTGLRLPFKVLWKGLDGLNAGPSLSGTGFYISRKALYYGCLEGMLQFPSESGLDLVKCRYIFGSSIEFIRTLDQGPCQIKSNEISKELLREVEFVASCTYEKDTEWGDGVGFFYHSLVEDFMTGYILHCRGWKSVYLDPERDPFLGMTTTNLNDVLTQCTRWYAGLLEVGLSRFCPLIFGPSRRGLSFLQRCCYAWLSLFPLMFLSGWCFAVIPQLCLLHGIPLYPKVSSMVFLVVAFVFMSSLIKHLHEVLLVGGTVSSWWNEYRMWAIKLLTCQTYGSLDAIMKNLGLKKTSFIPTNKITDEEQAKRYNQGIYDFQTSNMFLVPLGTVVALNMVCFIGGMLRMIFEGNWDEMAVQLMLSGYLLVLSNPVVEGMTLRKDKGRFPTYATMMSIGSWFVVLTLGPSILFH